MTEEPIARPRSNEQHLQAFPSLLPGQCAAEVTIRTRHCRPHMRHPRTADFVNQSIQKTFSVSGISLYAWCVMPDHVHLLIGGVTPVDLPRICYNFIRLSGTLALRRYAIELWQWRHQRRVLEGPLMLEHVARRIRENPQRSGLVPSGSQYRWCGAPLIDNPSTHRSCLSVC